MLVQFLVDFRGKLTREQFYLAGEQAEFDAGTAQALISEGRATEVSPTPAPEEAPAPPARPQRKSTKTGGGVL